MPPLDNCVTRISCASFLSRQRPVPGTAWPPGGPWPSPYKQMMTRVYACSGGAFCVLALVILATLSLSAIPDFKNIAVWEDGHGPLDVSGTESSKTETSHTIMILMNSTAAPISSQQIGEKLVTVTNNMTVPEKPFPPFGKVLYSMIQNSSDS